MGSSSSRDSPPIIARCSSPTYCVRVVGSRHILLGGGGGASKTGVPNNIQTLLLSFDSKSLAVAAEDLLKASEQLPLVMEVTNELKTDPYATMNMDCVLVGASEQGKYLLAAGHDEKLSRITSDEKSSNAYQVKKTVRFGRNVEGQSQRLYTGGADGFIRIWDVEMIRQGSTSKHTPLIKIKAHQGDVNDLDISPNGKLCISVGHDAAVHIWNTLNGEKSAVYLCRKKLVMSLGTVYGSWFQKHNIFGYLQSNSTYKKAVSHVALWAFNHDRNVCRPIIVREACKETISALAVSDCGNFFALGTMDGGVGIYDTHELRSLYFVQKHMPSSLQEWHPNIEQP
ncbi:Prolactin regulatory element-binding protein [Dirofilaria immitis]|nr:Prolactin regulatory element-binding protein [Dirofilaria immitis]